MPRTRVFLRIPVVSRVVVMMAAGLIAVSALVGLPDTSAPSYSTVAYSTVGPLSDTAPATPQSAAKCKKKCKKKYRVSDADLKNLSGDDVESVAALTTVLAVVALAAVI